MRKATSKSHWNVRESVEDQFITGKLHFLCLITNIVEPFVQPKDSVFIHQSEASPKKLLELVVKTILMHAKQESRCQIKLTARFLKR